MCRFLALLSAAALGCSTPGAPEPAAAETSGTMATTAPPDSSATGDETSSGPPDEGFSCDGDGAGPRNLRAFWTALDREYALFDIRLPGQRWDDLGNLACAQLGENDGDHALFDVLIELARNLDDGHTSLTANAIGRDEDAQVTVYPHDDVLFTVELAVEAEYLDGDLSWAARDWVAWGTIEDVGYLSLTSLDSLSGSGDEDDDRRAAEAAMEQVMADFAGLRGIVVDVRANGGGWDAVALDIATWFSGPRTLAWSEQVRDGPEHDDFGAWEDVFVEDAVAGAFDGPVVVLTSGGTFSAAETFVLAMRERDNVQIVGERTSGHFSDLFGGRLPNRWRYTFSGERYRAADGEVYEARGAPVDVEVPFDPAALEDGRDVMLEAALGEV